MRFGRTKDLIMNAIALNKFLNESRNFASKAQLDSTPESNSRYDFIVIGAGTAGAAVASRLSEIEDVTVLLIETGLEEELYMDIPLLANFLQRIPGLDWMYQTESSENYCRGMVGRKCSFPQGKVMGGSSVINFMIATRGNKWDYDNWARMGNRGWSYDDVLKYFKRLENMMIPEYRNDTAYHGTEGPVSINYPRFNTTVARTFVEAGQELGYPLLDYNGERQVGVSLLQSTTDGGVRMSSNKAYLSGKRRRNLRVTKLSTVHRILFDDGRRRAVGVEFAKRGRLLTVYADKEVIVSAGAISTPKLLMLSGIGPAEHLKELGIEVVRDARVGDNLMDHVAYGGLVYDIDQRVNVIRNDIFRSLILHDYFMDRDGPLTTLGGCEALAFIDVDDPGERDVPNMELLFLGTSIYTVNTIGKNFGLNEQLARKFSSYRNRRALSVFPMLLHPKSRGRIRLRSRNVDDKPRIFPNYMSDPDDIRMLIKGIKAANQFLLTTKAFQRLGARLNNETMLECEKLPFDSDAYWECNLRLLPLTIYHYSGTCKMGPESDKTAVVDPTLKVSFIVLFFFFFGGRVWSNPYSLDTILSNKGNFAGNRYEGVESGRCFDNADDTVGPHQYSHVHDRGKGIRYD